MAGDLFNNIDGSAQFSDCGRYRYVLTRTWEPSGEALVVVGLNPSTADAATDDPTIRRCKRFAADWGFGGLVMVNLFALRATRPEVMLRDNAPVGPDNDQYLIDCASRAGRILVAWGNEGAHLDRDIDVRHLLAPYAPLYCLGKTQYGHPRHPRYIKADKAPEVWE